MSRQRLPVLGRLLVVAHSGPSPAHGFYRGALCSELVLTGGGAVDVLISRSAFFSFVGCLQLSTHRNLHKQSRPESRLRDHPPAPRLDLSIVPPSRSEASRPLRFASRLPASFCEARTPPSSPVLSLSIVRRADGRWLLRVLEQEEGAQQQTSLLCEVPLLQPTGDKMDDSSSSSRSSATAKAVTTSVGGSSNKSPAAAPSSTAAPCSAAPLRLLLRAGGCDRFALRLVSRLPRRCGALLGAKPPRVAA